MLLEQSLAENSSFVEYALVLVGTSDRVVGLRLLTSALQSGQLRGKEGRVTGLLDRLPSLILSTSSISEADALSNLVGAILDLGGEELLAHLNKGFSKLASSCSRVIATGDAGHSSLLSALSVLQQLAHSRSRTLLLPSSIGVRQACNDLLSRCPTLYKEASSLLASMVALENATEWTAQWLLVSRECVDLLQNRLGVHVSVNKALASPCALPADTPQSGCRKALAVETCLRSKCQVLSEMLRVGCSSGPASCDLSAFVPLLQATLSLTLSLSPHDTKCAIVNDQGVSPVDLCLVSSSIKVHVLGVLRALLRGRHPGLARAAVTLCRPLLALLAGRECAALPAAALQLRALQCCSLCCEAFPSVVGVTLGGSTGLQALVAHFAAEVHVWCSHRGAVGVDFGVLEEGSSSSSSSSSSLSVLACMPRWMALADTIHSLLLFCGQLLPVPLRANIEAALGEALLCMCKGLLRRHGAETKTHRAPVELLRAAPSLQEAVLRLATTEALSSQRSGVLTGNLAALRGAAAAALQQPETGAAAMAASLALEALLQPAAVPLPAMPVVAAAGDALAYRATMSAAPAITADAPAFAASAGLGSSDGAEESRRRKAEAEAGVGEEPEVGQGRSKKPAPAPAAPLPAPASIYGAANKAEAAKKAKGGVDADEDGDLPEMDLDTAPESN
jgi:hypothetical protein